MSEQAVFKPSPIGFYHKAWSLVQDRFIFQERLQQWSTWEHKFDHTIKDFNDAVRCTQEMLASIGERYTALCEPPVTVSDAAEQSIPRCRTELLAQGIAYLQVSTFDGADLEDEVAAALQPLSQASAFIIDLRNNGGGYVSNAGNLVPLFLDQGPSYVFLRREDEYTLVESVTTLTSREVEQRSTYPDGRIETSRWKRHRNITGAKPIVLLVNRKSASATETFAGILRDNHRVFIIGEQTGGKGIGQEDFPMVNGYVLQITDSLIFPPSRQFFGDHRQTVDNGLQPDLVVHNEKEDDAQLAEAVSYINSSQRARPADSRLNSCRLRAGALALALMAGGALTAAIAMKGTRTRA